MVSKGNNFQAFLLSPVQVYFYLSPQILASMKKLELSTSQFVPIQYELAGLRDRIIGFATDLIMLLGFIIVVSIISPGIFSFGNPAFVLLVMPVVLTYSLLFETLNRGQSPGKMIVGIRVLRMDGKDCTITEYLTRWILRPVEIYSSFGALAALLIAGSEKRQRLGDIAAGTVVVKVRPQLRFSLNDILNLKTEDNYSPVYPGATTFSEEEMLLLKSALDRYRAYPNDAHREALKRLRLIVANRLGMETSGQSDEHFLKQVLTDYVILTR